MSTSSASLFIGYARASCTTEQVKQVFDNRFGADIVSKVDEVTKTDPKGFDFKIFFIHFGTSNPKLDEFLERLKTTPAGWIGVVYNTEYDKKQGQHLERYWKVLPFTQKPVKITGIRIMTEEETAQIARPKHLNAPIVDAVVELEEGEVPPSDC